MRLNEKKNLKLAWKNQEDLKVISAYLQDSIVISKDIKFSNNNHNIKILFSGESVISLVSEVLEAYMQDLGSAWNVKHISMHKIWILNYLVIFIKT